MSDATVVDQYPKAENSREQVLRIQRDRLAHGAKSCDESEDDTNYILTTVWPGDDGDANLIAATAHAAAAAAHASAASAHAEVASRHAAQPKRAKS